MQRREVPRGTRSLVLLSSSLSQEETTLGSWDTVSCTSLTHGLLKQDNLLLQLILRDHYAVVSLAVCVARFIPSRLH